VTARNSSPHASIVSRIMVLRPPCRVGRSGQGFEIAPEPGANARRPAKKAPGDTSPLGNARNLAPRRQWTSSQLMSATGARWDIFQTAWLVSSHPEEEWRAGRSL